MAAITQNAAGVFSLGGTSLGGSRTIADGDATTHFSGNVTINEPTYIVCGRLNPTVAYNLVVNAPLYVRFTSGLTGLGDNDGTIGNAVVGTGASVIVNRDQGGLIVWECTNNATNGWGSRGVMNTNTVVDNQRFIGFGDDGLWFINVDAIGPVQLSGFEFIQTAFNGPRVNNNFNGFLFDGTRRDQALLQGRYTFRYQSTSNDGSIIYNSVFAGDDYTDLTGNDKTLHYQYNGVLGADSFLYSVNNLYENTQIVLAGAAGGNFVQPIVEGFAFNIAPTVIDSAGVSSIIADAAVTGFSNLTRNVQATRDAATFLTTDASDGLINSNGYFLETGRQEPDQNNNASVLAKALDWSADGALNIVTGFQPTLRLYSYTNSMDNQSTTITQASAFDIAGDGTVTFRDEGKIIELGIDDILVTGTVSGDYPVGFEVSSDLEAYRVAKADWYRDRKQYDYPVTGQGDFTGMDVTFAATNDLTSSTAITINAGEDYEGNLIANAWVVDGQNLSNGTYNVSSITGTIGTVETSTITNAGTTDLTVGTVSGSTINTGGALTIGNISESSIVAAGALTIPSGFVAAEGSSITGAGITGLDVTDINFDITNTGSTVTILENSNVTRNLTGSFTISTGTEFSGDIDIDSGAGGTLTFPDDSIIDVVGTAVNIPTTANIVFGNNVDFVLSEGASKNSLFGTRDLTGPGVDVIIDPLIISVINNGTGTARVAVIDQDGNLTSEYTFAGSIAPGTSEEIRIQSSQIDVNTWTVFVTGEGIQDTSLDVTYTTDLVTLVPGVDANHTSGLVLDNWAVATDFINQEEVVDDLSQRIYVLDETVDANFRNNDDFAFRGQVADNTAVINYNPNTNAVTLNQQPVGALNDAFSIVYRGNNPNEFGLVISSGAEYQAETLNANFGNAKSHQAYADYVALNGIDTGINLIQRDTTRLYYSGPDLGTAIVDPPAYAFSAEATLLRGAGFNGQVFSATTPTGEVIDGRARFILDWAWDTTDGTNLLQYGTDGTGGGSGWTVAEWNTLTGGATNSVADPSADPIPGDNYAGGTIRNLRWTIQSQTQNGAINSNTPPFYDVQDEDGNGLGGFQIVGWYESNNGVSVTSVVVEYNTADFEGAVPAGIPTLTAGAGGLTQDGWGLGIGMGAAHFMGGNSGNNLRFIQNSISTGEAVGSEVRTYVQVDLTTNPTPFLANGIEVDVESIGGNNNINTTGVTALDDTDDTAFIFNNTVIDGATIGIYPAPGGVADTTGTADIVPLGIDYLGVSEINYSVIQARATAGIRSTGVVDQVDNNNERLQHINTGQASKIPIRTVYDSSNFEPDDVD